MKKEKISLIKHCLWDYDYEDQEIEKLIQALKEGIVQDENFLIRIIENLEWYTLIEIIPIDKLLSYLTKERLQKIRSKRRRENLANAKSILLEQPLPFPRWDRCDFEKTRHGLLSNRWYGTK